MKNILFVCIENSCRSQIAEGFAKMMAGDLFNVYSAGSRPSGVVNPTAINVMQEIGIDISKNDSKGFDDLPVKKFDRVITLGCGDQCPFVPADVHIDWKIPDPKGHDLEFFRSVRDLIKQHVQQLIQELT
ncbi:MAG TPA: arsenate reductase ArsC [Candidatus Omnitrophota bacterium]|nr:arsenate reductase ArsC [Candidatus Omnitrophota bacterium]HQL42036.1 arsenate reductase ArsC [Candidatus Omnitrophota bacterium]